MEKVYIFDDEAKAQAFALTARYLGYQLTRVGSAVLCQKDVYETLLAKTFAIPAAIVTTQDEE